MRPKQLPDAYFAGLIDGEGYVAVETFQRKDRPSLRNRVIVRVAMTDLPTIEALQRRWPSPLIFKPRARDHWKDQWIWQRGDRSVNEVLIAIRPYVVTKHDAVEECIRFLKEMGRW